MTFPSSSFPRTTFDGTPCTSEYGDPYVFGSTRLRQFKTIGTPTCERCRRLECLLPYYAWEHRNGYTFNADRHVHSPPRDFPVLRASPLWRQMWVEHLTHSRYGPPHDRGYWFPPLDCKHAVGRRSPVYYQRRECLVRLYSVDNCADCTAALQAVELMVYGVAWEMQQWPDAWEHRCYWRMTEDARCTHGVRYDACSCGANFSMTMWTVEAEEDIEHWAWRNRVNNGVGLAREHPIATFNGFPVWIDDITLGPNEGLIVTSRVVPTVESQWVMVEWDET